MLECAGKNMVSPAEFAARPALVTVRFTSHRAVVEDRQGGAIESLWLTTLHEIRYRAR
jgi:hypothetical protein